MKTGVDFKSKKQQCYTVLLKMLGMLSLAVLVSSCAKDQPYEEVYKVPEVSNRGLIDTTKEYLYVKTTGATNRKVTSALPFYQGEVKLVKLKFEKDGLKVYQNDDDPRFQGNIQNDRPVLTIPAEYKDYQCALDDLDECTNKEEENTETTWDQKQYFLPDFASLKSEENNFLDLINLDTRCVSEVGTKVVNYEMSPGVLNIELEKTFKTSDAFFCIANYYYSDNLENSTFSTRYYYSLIEKSEVTTKGYKPVDYPAPEHSKFGFFKTQSKKLNHVFDGQREEVKFYLNRFAPGKTVEYHLSDTFNKPENLYLKEATYKAIENINKSLRQGDVPLSIKLIEPSGKKVGDLRVSMINLIDDPLDNGLLGYGPSVKDPTTGEIVKAHTNMYSGVLRTGVRRSYQAMVDLSVKRKEATLAQTRAAQTTATQIDDTDVVDTSAADTATTDSEANLLDLIAKMRAMKNPNLEDGIIQQVDFNALDDQRLKKITRNLQKVEKNEVLRAFDFKTLDDKKFFSDLEKTKEMDLDQWLYLHSRYNAYHISMFNFESLSKYMFDGVYEIKGIHKQDGTLKNWAELSVLQQETVAELVMVNTYTATLTHEIGHNLGLRHNFQGSFDKDNFYSKDEAKELGLKYIPSYSSIMDYAYSDLNELSVFGKYDMAALRFGYARKVEVDTEIAGSKTFKLKEVKTNLADLKKDLASQAGALSTQLQVPVKLTLKEYGFCTDENAGLSMTCNRFDEGTNATEIAQHLKDHYDDSYRYANWRDGRRNFSVYGTGRYASWINFRFRRMRQIHEMYEVYNNFLNNIEGLPKNLMETGCPPELRMMAADLCKTMDEIRAGVEIVGDTFLNILKSPDHTCALATAEKPTEVAEYKKLQKIYEDARFDDALSNYVPQSCFDKPVQDLLKAENKVVVGEAGKYLNDIKDPDPRYRYVTDIRVRGRWSDKVLAAKQLAVRHTFTSSTEDYKSSLLDIGFIRSKFEDLASHLVLKTPLANQIPFKKEDGSTFTPKGVNLIDGIEDVIPEQPSVRTIRMLGLPMVDNVPVNKLVLSTIANKNLTNDVELRKKSRELYHNLSLKKYTLTTTTDTDADLYQKKEIDGEIYYAFKGKNGLAESMFNIIDLHDELNQYGPMNAIATIQLKSEIVAALEGDEAIVAKGFPLEAIIGLKEQLEGMPQIPGEDQVSPQFKPIIRLGVEGLAGLIKKLTVAPDDAPEAVKALFSKKIEDLGEYATGQMKARVDSFSETVRLLNEM